METRIDINEERKEKAYEKLKKWRNEIDEELEKDLERAKKEAKNIDREGERVIEYLEDYTLRGGKRIRPGLIVAGCKAVSDKNHEDIIKASIAAEHLQSYLIIQDDIYDEDDLRRGKATVHKMYEKHHEKELGEGNKQKFGRDLATITGDVAASLATHKLIKSNFDKETRLRAIEKLEKSNRETNYGQALDIKTNNTKLENVEEEDIITVHKTKTARYTIAYPLDLGWILGNGDKEQRELLKNYGMKIGVAFQLYDDMLGLYGTKEKLGKPVDSDLKEGKKTLLMIKAYENGDEEQREKIKQALGNKNITKKQVEEVRKIVKETGSYKYSREKCEELIKEGKSVIEDTEKIDKEIKNFLLGIADYIITREV